ncbi:sulfite exporter TauE/SafE family protein [Deltaproteobacteria bacterium TL4]
MSYDLSLLIVSSASIAFFHTLLGPDHYIPFIAMSQSGKWSLPKTIRITLFCGLGHLLSSILLGGIGIAFGIAVNQLQSLEAWRGNIAAWALIAFGLVYAAWGMKHATKNKTHQHIHVHENGNSHEHIHVHQQKHVHVHPQESTQNTTPWVLFIIFILGPCEPLIPLMMYPAAKHDLPGLVLVVSIFMLITILTMLSIVLISTFGINLAPSKNFERYNHAIAGSTIFFCGIAIQFLGL